MEFFLSEVYKILIWRHFPYWNKTSVRVTENTRVNWLFCLEQMFSYYPPILLIFHQLASTHNRAVDCVLRAHHIKYIHNVDNTLFISTKKRCFNRSSSSVLYNYKSLCNLTAKACSNINTYNRSETTTTTSRCRK